MIDTRKPLVIGSFINQNDEITYEIRKVIGRGANCLVYDAKFTDQLNISHRVRVKELYPMYISIQRKNDALIVEGKSVARFEEIKKQFSAAYEKNVIFKNTEGIVNSTSDAQQIFCCNNTWYVIFGYDEGADYCVYTDSSLWEMLKHIRALASVIQKYHDNNFLHLDIKPENIFVIPETPEHILLFDFDSVIAVDDLKNSNAELISYSDGFSAPEQIRGNVSKVNYWSDVYSVGAVMYYKLFGIKPNLTEMQLGSSVSLDKSLFVDELVSPKLLKKVQLFLKKTLALSINARWKDMKTLVKALDEMIPLAEPNAMLVIDNFSYNEYIFVGRERELLEIDQILEKKQAVFLSGIGGIGKTEIAKNYAFINREKYDTIVFLRFDKSIKETILSDDIIIRNFEYELKEDTSFENKLKVLKRLLSPKDLLIVDNFDVEYDDNLENLLECRCKFIFTARADFRDFQYEQIDISSFDNTKDMFDLFFSFNNNYYDDEQKNALELLFNLVESHTMMVVLLSKYLRDSIEQPIELYNRFLEVEGVTNTSELGVKHRKDKKLYFDNINRHLRILFQFSDFSDDELNIMRSLSLLGAVRIQLDVWLEMVNRCFTIEQVNKLIKKGWIEETQCNNSCKISLHQIIMDLVYNEQNPNTDNCSASISGYISFVQKKEKQHVKRYVQKRIADALIERVNGRDLLLAQLYYSYCLNIKCKAHLLDVAEELCQREENEIAVYLLVDIIILRMKKIQGNISIWGKELEEIESCISQLYNEVFKREVQIFKALGIITNNCMEKEENSVLENDIGQDHILFWKYIDENSELNNEKQYQSMLALSNAIYGIAESIYSQRLDDEFISISALYLNVEHLLLYLYQNVIKNNVSCHTFEIVESILMQLIKYYENDLSKPAEIVNEEKSAKYTEMLYDLHHSKKGDVLYLEGVSYMDAANELMWEEKYNQALCLYEKSLLNKESVFDDIMFRMVDAHINLGEYEEAEKKLLQVLEYDKNMGLDECFTYLELIRLYKKIGDTANLKLVCNEIIKRKDNDNSENFPEWLLMVLIELIQIDDNNSIDYQVHIENYLRCLHIIADSKSIDSNIFDSLVLFWRKCLKEVYIPELAKIYYKIATYYRLHYNKEDAKELYKCIINNEFVQNSLQDIYMNSLLWVADLCIHGYTEDYALARQLLDIADNYELSLLHNKEYYENKIIYLKNDLLKYDYNISDYDAMLCNYHLIVQHELSESDFSLEQQFEIWLEAVESCICDANFDVLCICLEELERSLNSCFNVYRLKKYIEKVVRALELPNMQNAKLMEKSLWAYILEAIHMSQLTKEEQDEVSLCYAQEIVRCNWNSAGFSVFIQYLLSLIKNERYKEIEENDFEVSDFLVNDLSTEKVDNIVVATGYFIELIKKHNASDEYYNFLDTIMKYYQESYVEFKNR